MCPRSGFFVPSFRFLYPRPGFWYRRCFFCALVPVLGVQGTSAITTVFETTLVSRVLRRGRKSLISVATGGTDRKNPHAHKKKLALPPFPENPNTALRCGILWAWGFSSRKNQKMRGAHKIGAAISGPRIAGGKLRTWGLFWHVFAIFVFVGVNFFRLQRCPSRTQEIAWTRGKLNAHGDLIGAAISGPRIAGGKLSYYGHEALFCTESVTNAIAITWAALRSATFKSIDAANEGFIEKSELSKALQSMGVQQERMRGCWWKGRKPQESLKP